jgi:hypothetical protein
MENLKQDKHGYIYEDWPEGDIIEITIRYDLGGNSSYNGKVNQRGLYIHVTPVTIERDHGLKFRSYKANRDSNVSGVKYFAVALKKNSAKATTTLANHIDGKVVEWAAIFRKKGAQAAFFAIRDYFYPTTIQV